MRSDVVTHACGHRWTAPRSTPEARARMARELCPSCGINLTVPQLGPRDAWAEVSALVASFEGQQATPQTFTALAEARRLRNVVWRQILDVERQRVLTGVSAQDVANGFKRVARAGLTGEQLQVSLGSYARPEKGKP